MSRTDIGLKDIAEKAGVSAMTVSRVMRNHPGVSEATSSRIRQIAEEMGYKSNRLARGMKSGRSSIIGFIMPEEHALGSAIFNGAYGFFHHKDMMVSVDLVPGNIGQIALQEQNKLIDRLLEIRVDGIILLPVSDSPEDDYITRLMDKNIPVVFVDRDVTDFTNNFVGTDDGAGGREAAEVFLKNGCRRALLISTGASVSTSRLRIEGFRQRAAELGLEVVSELECPDFLYNTESIFQLVQQHKGQFDSIFAVADPLAISAWHSCVELGIAVPDEVKIIGFGALDLSDPRYRISSFNQEPVKIGYQAASLLWEMIESRMSKSKMPKPRVITKAPQYLAGFSCPSGE